MNNQARFLIPAITALVVLVSSSSGAQNMAKEMLARDYEKCVLGCLPNNEGAICEVLCDCTIRHFSELEQGDYVRLQIELNSGRVTDDHRRVLDRMALACAAAVDAKFPGLVPPAKSESSGDPQPVEPRR